MPRPPRVVFPACALIWIGALGARATTTGAPWLRNVDPRRLSAGLYAALDAEGAFGTTPTPHPVREGAMDLSKGKPSIVLDARVGTNIRLGDDPAALPDNQRGQVEPQIFRSASDPQILLATFQDGRFSDAGALDCGYALSLDGGMTWTRSLIPRLTLTAGGTYNRATDPVAAIGPGGEFYLNTLVSESGAFVTSAVVLSRSMDGGTTWLPPSVVFRPASSLDFPDKNWLAVNDRPGTPHAGRLVVTWTNFTSSSSGETTGDNILSSVSDDQGATWAAPIAVTGQGSFNQGSQPVFLPDGSLVVVYVTFPSAKSTSPFRIECKRSTDGGTGFSAPSTPVADAVVEWDDPDLREGSFLPSAAVARETGDLFVCFAGVIDGTPRVLVARSADRGASWSAPVVCSDNPAGVSVVNPAVAVTPDGQTVSVVYLDKRNAPDGHNFIDTYAAQSFDAGATWQPSIRLTGMSSDIRYAPLTTSGYMLGDYLGVAPALSRDEPCVAIWCDTRTGDSDPFAARFAPSPDPTYAAWALAEFNAGETRSGPGDDFDGDGVSNGLEYVLGSNPRVAESGEAIELERRGPTSFTASIAVRRGLEDRLHLLERTLPAALSSGPAQPPQTPDPVLTITRDDGAAPDIPADPGLSVVGFSVSASDGAPFLTILDDSGNGTTETAAAGTNGRLVNVSTRGYAGAGDASLIVGFVIDGEKSILLRAAGPSLAAFGVSGVLALPQLSLMGGSGLVPTSDISSQPGDFSGALFSRLGAFPFAPGSGDTAVVPLLPQGGYTAIVTGADGGTGVALVEAYDADAVPGDPSGPHLANLSARGRIGADNALIAGFVLTGTQQRRLLIRAVGPSLAQYGVNGVLDDPMLTLHSIRSGQDTVVATNDDWQTSRSDFAVAATAKRLGAFPLSDGTLDAALLISLEPGAYSVVVTGAKGGSGIGLVEIYDAD